MKRLFVLVMILSSLLLVIPACGGGGETPTSNNTTTAAPTITDTEVATMTPTLTNTEPVKIGAITPWSGAAALSGTGMADPIIKLVEWQVKQKGGILGGRELKVVRYDNRASVAEAQAGARKLILDDKVSALAFGGISKPEMDAVSDEAEANNVLYATMGSFSNVDAKVTLSATYSHEALMQPIYDVVNKIVKAKTVGFLAADMADDRVRIADCKAAMVGVQTVFEEYAPVGTVDYSPYLSKMKYQNPEVLFLDSGQNEFVISVAKQIMELGGWGNTKVVTLSTGESAIKYPGADGWYVESVWAPNSPNEASQKFVNEYRTVNGGAPNTNQIYYYNCLLIALTAIEMAGSDDSAKVAEFVKTGKLVVDLPTGLARFTLENKGYGGLSPVLTHIEGGKLVPVIIEE